MSMQMHMQKQDIFDLIAKHNALDNLLRGSDIQELELSYKSLQSHFETDELAHIAEKINNKRQEYTKIVSDYQQSFDQLTMKKTEVFEALKSLFDLYQFLNNAHLNTTHNDIDSVQINENDEFIVNMAKLLYPNGSDNMQLRDDPPISGVQKKAFMDNQTGMFCKKCSDVSTKSFDVSTNSNDFPDFPDIPYPKTSSNLSLAECHEVMSFNHI